MNLSLSGKYAVICGASRGIGLAIAKELALLGANCTLMARDESSLLDAMKSLDTSLRQSHEYIVVDFALAANVKKSIELHVANEPVHILVNNSGGPPAGPITEANIDLFEKYFRQHVISNQVMVQACLPSMKSAGYGRIINVVSTSVKVPIQNLGVSNTIRGAVASWAKSLSNEVAEFGITVNNVLPGYTKTERLEILMANIAEKKQVMMEDVEKEMIREIPAKRFAEAEEIAALAAFLATPAAGYINGTSIQVDGGRTGSI
jgi:3-oxoacyl-[acyl-carrier protein] reductase